MLNWVLQSSKRMAAILMLALGSVVVGSPAKGGEITYVYSAGPTAEWPGSPPQGWLGTNPGPFHDAFAVFNIPKYYLPGTAYVDTIYRAVLTGSASHDGFAVAQLYSLGGQNVRSDLPGGIQYVALSTGFAREFTARIIDKSINATGPGAFLNNWQNDGDFSGTDYNQYHPAVVQVAARLSPPSADYYASSAGINATWYVTHLYSGVPEVQEAPDKFKISESEKRNHLLKAQVLEAKQEAIGTAQYLVSVLGASGGLAGELIDVIDDAIVEARIYALGEAGGSWGKIISTALGLIVGIVAVYTAAGLATGAIALAAVTASATLLFAETYYEYGKNYELQKYADPPDPYYTLVDQYNSDILLIDLGLGEEKQAFFQEGFSVLSKSVDSALGVLNAYERGQGAILAGDAGAAWFQARSLERFQADEAANNLAAEDWLKSAEVSQTVTAVPEPATWAMMLVGFGMMGGVLRYRHRSTSAAYI